jgi:hypothetical protein
MNASQVAKSFSTILLAVLAMLSCPTWAKQSTTEDPDSYSGSWYRIALDANGRSLGGDGHGYGSGTWYFYPETRWHRQWFYNQPFDAAGKGNLKYEMNIRAVDTTKPTTIEINVNWTTPSWSQRNAKQPPLPQDAPTAREEQQYMLSRGLYHVDSQSIRPETLSFTLTVEQYCPEWVSIDIRGQNAHIYGGVINPSEAKAPEEKPGDGTPDEGGRPEERLEPQVNSGKGGLKWSQAAQQFDAATPFIFNGWGERSNLHLRTIAADDWRCEDGRPITGVQWSGSFEGWTESALPAQMPLAFHLAIWTHAATAPTGDARRAGRPDTLVWEAFCTRWAWNIAGYHGDPRQIGDDTCFQFTYLLSQDQWFYPQLATDGGKSVPAVYWLSIAAFYDPNAPAPRHPWAWTTRPQFFNAGAVQITGLEPTEPRSAVWPPTLGSRWQSGGEIEFPRATAWDLAFELLTNHAGYARDPELAPVYRFWSDKLGGHFYTISETEKDKLIRDYRDTWTFEGIAFYAYPPDRAPIGSKPVYRFWSNSTGRHFYSISEREKQKLVDEYARLWTFEGIAWYAFD